MHPELLNNSLFLRYYEKWQKDPTSIVFTAISEFFLKYKMIDDAYKICKKGLEIHPDLIIARIVMAKIFCIKEDYEQAEEELFKVLEQNPTHVQAIELIKEIENTKKGFTQNIEQDNLEIHFSEKNLSEPENMSDEWNTITMAKVYESQGLVAQAEKIYNYLLSKDPGNEEAKRGLSLIEK